MDAARIERAAGRIAEWRMGGTPIPPLPPEETPRSEDEAYAIQAALHAHLARRTGSSVSGFKIGCTTPAMRAYLNIPQPCAGGVFGGAVIRGGGAIRASDYLKVGVECELAVILGRSITPADTPRSLDDAADAVAAATAAMEIVDDRYADYAALGIHPLIADDFFNAGAVLGPPVPAWQGIDLRELRGEMRINGAVVGSGIGADVMGNPLEALLWLARRFGELGWTLPRGSFVLLGSVVQTHWLSAGDDVRCTLFGLGQTDLSVR